jgi:hypothetical protein
MRRVLVVAVVAVVLGFAAGATDDNEKSFVTEDATEPLAELLLGRWRVDVVVQDFSEVLRESLESQLTGRDEDDGSIADDVPLGRHIADAWHAVVGTSKTVIRSAVQRFWPDEHGFHLELSRGLHDGVLVGKVTMQDAGHHLIRDVLKSGVNALGLPPVLALDDAWRSPIDAPIPYLASAVITVECSTLTTCRMYVGGSAGMQGGEDAAAAPANAEPFGELQLVLPFRSKKSVGTNKIRAGKWEWKPARGMRFVTGGDAKTSDGNGTEGALPAVVEEHPATPLRGGLLVATNKHGMATVASADPTNPADDEPLMRQHRLILRRETPDLNQVEPPMPGTIAWLSGSWWHVAVYGLLLGLVLFGKFGTRWYFKTFKGVDIDPWLKSMHSGKRETKKKRRLMSDAEIHALMASDDAADRSRHRRTGKKD